MISLSELRALYEKVSHNDWIAVRIEPESASDDFSSPYSPWVIDGAGPRCVSVGRGVALHADDAEFIVALHNAILAAIERKERA